MDPGLAGAEPLVAAGAAAEPAAAGAAEGAGFKLIECILSHFSSRPPEIQVFR